MRISTMLRHTYHFMDSGHMRFAIQRQAWR